MNLENKGEGEDTEKTERNAVNTFNSDYDPTTGKYTIKKVIMPSSFAAKDPSSYAGLCNDLKQLYVSLTRPRNRIIIYDENTAKRKYIEHYWKELSLVEVITKEILEKSDQQESENIKDVANFQALIKGTSAEEWKQQGLKMFKNKYYEQAYKCFQKSGDEDLKRRCEAYMLADKASANLSKVQTERTFLEEKVQQYANVSEKERKAKLQKLKVEEQEAYNDFVQAAEIFDEIKLDKQAGQCYFSAGKYEKALEFYQRTPLPREAGEACYMLKQYEKAAELFREGRDYIRAIDCLEKCKNYEAIVNILDEFKDLPSDDRKVYAQKFVPLALSGLVGKVEFQNENEIKEKNDGEIQEADSEDEEEEQKGDTGKKSEVIEKKSSQKEDKNANQEGLSEISFEVIDKKSDITSASKKEIAEISFKEPKDPKNVSNISFEVVEDAVDNFDHLSQYDLQDEFLQIETGSVIESISSLRKKESQIYSDFSAVEYSYLMSNEVALVKTKADIFVQDEVMTKIIRYVGIISDDFRSGIERLKTQGVLVSNQFNPNDINVFTEQIIDFDNITLDFVYLILDFLEQSKLYKLCIFVCNRYKLSSKLGRYLGSMAFKYSNFPYEDMTATSTKILLPRSLQVQHEKAYISNIALHNILEITNPSYLKLKKKGEKIDETNSLGEQCFTQLISLGFWKKTLFIMDYYNSLAVASAYASFKNYKIIYLTGNPTHEKFLTNNSALDKLLAQEDFKWLPFNTPSTLDEINASIVALESVIWDLTEKFPVYLHDGYQPEAKKGSHIDLPEFPSYFELNQVLWDLALGKKGEVAGKFEEAIMNSIDGLNKIIAHKDLSDDLVDIRVYDTVSFLTQILLLCFTNHNVGDAIASLKLETLIRLILAYKGLFAYLQLLTDLDKNTEIVIKAFTGSFRYPLSLIF